MSSFLAGRTAGSDSILAWFLSVTQQWRFLPPLIELKKGLKILKGHSEAANRSKNVDIKFSEHDAFLE
jgi:hypothetical protein